MVFKFLEVADPDFYFAMHLNNMLYYKRPIKKNLTALKLLLIVLISAIACSIYFQIYNLGYFSFVVFIFCSLFSFTGFEVSNDYFIVEKYHFYGLIKKQWRFEKNSHIKITSFGLPFGYKDDVSFAEGDTAVGCLFSIILFFTIKPTITHKRFTIEAGNRNGGIIQSVTLFLNEEEFDLIKSKD